ncbi:MAG TPA: hypothetical protein PK919_06220 [Candidatus Aminicenantes bacterium]|nr:hypothetical protein [Candidatus Aminicenantes bacterium]
MGLIDRLLPLRPPRQVVFAGERHAEVFRLRNGRVAHRVPVPGAALAEDPGDDWQALFAALEREETGVVFGASPFIFNVFEFDRLPWRRQALRELVAWRLQKIFPENIEAYDHRWFVLNRRRVLSVLVRRSLLDSVESAFHERNIPLTAIGSSTLQILGRALGARPVPDLVIERDGAGCTLAFLQGHSPIYIRKFRGVSESPADAGDEIGRTVSFVRGQYGIDPRRCWLHDHGGETAAVEAALQELSEEALGGGRLSPLPPGPGPTPHLPVRP